MSVSKDDVHYIAELARLRFTDEEEENMAEQLSGVLDYMEKLDELDTEDVPPMSHVLDITNVFRDDSPEQRISREEALGNAPDADHSYFRVPRVID
jgi:aspartyl-tRNA(Asn)/glutamyl-tRNA(Gln) amidotransferase subunit C